MGGLDVDMKEPVIQPFMALKHISYGILVMVLKHWTVGHMPDVATTQRSARTQLPPAAAAAAATAAAVAVRALCVGARARG